MAKNHHQEQEDNNKSPKLGEIAKHFQLRRGLAKKKKNLRKGSRYREMTREPTTSFGSSTFPKIVDAVRGDKSGAT